MPTRSISVLNMKGGVGKTTLAVNIAWHLSRQGKKRVLLVELDPQFNASQYLMRYEDWEKHCKTKGTVADIVLEPARNRMPLRGQRKKARPATLPIHTVEAIPPGRFDLIPSQLSLGRA